MGDVVNVPDGLRAFWNRFQASRSQDVSSLFHGAFYFGDDERMAGELAALVLAGQKRGTACLLWTYESLNEPPPTVGALSVVTDWQGGPLFVIEATHVQIVPFDRVSSTFAAIEGEGDGSLSYWRDAHWRCFGRECQRLGREPSAEMLVVCEQFRVVYPVVDPTRA
jgi:uncharacterized protein YhfF